MSLIRCRFQVDQAMAVAFTHGVADPGNPILDEVLASAAASGPARVLVYLDQSVADACPDLPVRLAGRLARCPGAMLVAPVRLIAGGEAAKDGLAVVERIARDGVEQGICRHSYIMAIGGGAVLDAVGFAAAVLHRGIRLVRLPTTTLAQADGGLGVKNAVNLFGIKNLVGSFAAPWAVINDAAFLPFQDERSWRAGTSEAVKVAAIADAGFLARIAGLAGALRARDLTALREVVERSALLHLDHITAGGDPFERGSSRPLDFGHWSAHRLESMSGHRIQHGEAVAIGLAIDTGYAVAIGRLDAAEGDRIMGTLESLGFRLWDESLDDRTAEGRREIYAGLDQFREHLGGPLTIAMPDGLGRRRDIDAYDTAIADGVLAELARRDATRRRGLVTTAC